MEEERDFVVFTDDNGEEFELDVIDYFEYEGDEYAILMDFNDDCGCEDEDCDCEHDVYIMKIIVEGDEERFVPADDDKFDVLAGIAEEILGSGCDCEDGECDCGCEDGECDCEDGECGCGGHHHDGGECGCGCHGEK